MCAAGADGAVAALAASQHSAFGRRQAAEIGISNEATAARVRNGAWLEPIPGVLVVAAARRTWQQRFIIPTLIRPGGVVVSHSSAARLHGLDGFTDDRVHVTVVAGRFPTMPGVKVHRDGVWDPNDHTRVDNIPCTNIARTLCDLGAVVKSDDLVEQALDDALRKGVSEKWIRQTLERVDRPGPSGTARLRRVLARPDRAGRLPDSVFERLVERGVQEPSTARAPAPSARDRRPPCRVPRHRMAGGDARGGSDERSLARRSESRAERQAARHVVEARRVAHRVPNVGGGSASRRVRRDDRVALPQSCSSAASSFLRRRRGASRGRRVACPTRLRTMRRAS